MKYIGFYRELNEGNSESYHEKISITPLPSYPVSEVKNYLNSGHPILDVTEMTVDVINGKFRVPGGSSVLTDGSFVWRQDLACYVEHYGVALPHDFLRLAASTGYRTPPVEQQRLIDISLSVSRDLGFRTDPGAGPRQR
ncbi:hypothetical protein [Streptomyces sp. L2]|uniref:hypothetical protein n=1 Tax=Streptomyces sp. L2 TaxID=2162665 RepID=UPI0010122173|nr:hypothetical protein [Streptomyces sp. L2]